MPHIVSDMLLFMLVQAIISLFLHILNTVIVSYVCNHILHRRRSRLSFRSIIIMTIIVIIRIEFTYI